MGYSVKLLRFVSMAERTNKTIRLTSYAACAG